MSICSIARIDSFHRDGYLLRMQRRVERLVQVVREHDLEGVLARSQIERGLGLTLAEMQYLVGRRQRRIELQFAEVGVDEQVMMTGVVEFDPRRCDPHSLQAEAHG